MDGCNLVLEPGDREDRVASGRHAPHPDHICRLIKNLESDDLKTDDLESDDLEIKDLESEDLEIDDLKLEILQLIPKLTILELTMK